VTARDAKTGRFVKLAPGALTAAVSVIPVASIEEKVPRTATNLQERAWRLWRILGVLQFPTSFKAKQVARLGWNVTEGGKQLEPDAAKAAMESVTKPLGVSEVTERLALNLEVAGQVFYARVSDEWKVYAATTPRLKELLKKADIVVEGLRPDPEKPKEPFSAVFAALGTAEQIRLMAAMSRGQDRNRLAQRGILLVPKEGQFPEDDPFMPMLEAAMTAPIADEYAASAVVPPVVTFPAEYIEKWRHLVLESPYDEKLMDRIEATIRQFALELDLPPEMLLGNMDSNHWNAWLSSEENVNAYTVPLGTLVGDVIATAMMEAVNDGRVVTVTPDPAVMLARSASVDDAFRALEMLVVGFDFVRRIIGADEDDAPTPEEIELILRATGKAAPVEIPQQGTDEVGPPEQPRELPAPSPNGNGRPVAAAVNGDDPLDRLSRQLTAIDDQLLGHLKGAAELAVFHAREVVGSEDVGAQDRIAEEMERLGKAWARQLKVARNSLKHLGIDAEGPQWELAAQASVHQLVDGLAVYVAENLDKTDSEMPAIPTDLLRQVLATAGGSGTADA
jgi:hypothetical protein